MKKFLFASMALATAGAMAAQLSYEIPATLSYYGTIEAQEGIPYPAANFVTNNPVNEGACIWVPKGSMIMYKNTSGAGYNDVAWVVPGATDRETVAGSVIVRYDEVGTFDFPTLVSGEETFKHDLKIKVGGKAELCHSDIRKWGETYGLGYAPFNGGNGYLGGTNKVNIAGVGNFYRFSSPDMYVDGVNIYLAKAPGAVPSSATMMTRVFLPFLGDGQFSMIGQFGALGALEGENVPINSAKTSADGVWLPSSNFAVYNVDFSTKLNCEGLPYLFFAVEGFSYDQNADMSEDFVLATDVMPARELNMEDYNNALAHNSFVRQGGETDYIRPVSVFGGSSMTPAGNFKSYNFWICPMVRGAETPVSGVEDIVTGIERNISLERDGDNLIVTGVADGQLSIVALDGTIRSTAKAANGGAIFNTSSLAHGVYVVVAADGQTIKFVK